MSILQLITSFRRALEDGTLVKLHLSGYRGPESDLQSVLVRDIMLKDGPAAQFVYRHRKNDITKNTGVHEAPVLAASWLNAGHFAQALLFTTREDFHLDLQKLDKPRLHRKPASVTEKPGPDHDRRKKRALATGGSWMQALGLTDAQGAVLKASGDKFRQINHFLELLEPEIKTLEGSGLRVHDMGCGKGYLTFALYERLRSADPLVQVYGIDQQASLMTFCNEVAQGAGFSGLSFSEGSITGQAPGKTDVLVALHACDTATDDALWAGIKAGAQLIAAAPCCHKEVRRAMEGRDHGALAPVSRFGVFLEREAEMLTDAIRALVLEYHGYRVKVLEFVSDAHTPKNVLLLAARTGVTESRKAEVLEQLRRLKSPFGIRLQALEARAGLPETV